MRHGERTLFDEALNYFVTKQERDAPGCVLRFRGKPVKDMVWEDRDKIRVILEWSKETTGIAARNGHVTIFPGPMASGAGQPLATPVSTTAVTSPHEPLAYEIVSSPDDGQE